MTPGLASVAAVVRDHNGHPVAGLAVTYADGGPERLDRAGHLDSAVAHRETRGRNRRHRGAVVTPESSSEGASMSPLARRSRRRLVWSGTVAAAVVASALTIPTSGAGSGSGQPRRGQRGARRPPSGLPHEDPPGTPPHSHNDPATKNLISRAGEVGRNAQDPTTAAERAASAAYVAAERSRPDPKLTKAAAPDPDPGPADAVRDGQRLLRPRRQADLLQAHDARRLPPLRQAAHVRDRGRRSRRRTRAQQTEWTARKVGNRFTFTNGGKKLRIGGTDRFALVGHQGLRPLPRVRHQHPRGAVRRRHAVPGGARVRRRAHPRDGVRVPRRPGALRQALGQVRRAVRAAGLRRPLP